MAANHLDAIIALTNGPAWPTNGDPNAGDLNGHFEYFVGSSTAAAVSAIPTSRCPPATTLDCRWDHLHRSSLGGTEVARPRLRL